MSGDYVRWAGWMRSGSLLATLALLVVVAFETLIMPSGTRQPNAVVWLLLSLPLLIFLPGLWRGGMRSYAWLSFVSMLYFAQSVTALFVVQPRVLDMVALVASMALFICTLLFVRWRARADRGSAEQA